MELGYLMQRQAAWVFSVVSKNADGYEREESGRIASRERLLGKGREL